MPEHIVVRCYSCQSFQAQQLRKTNDFVCKMCGSKQSVRKIYARSFKAADIRPIVQEYNMKRGEIEEEAAQHKLKQVEQRASEDEVYHHEDEDPSHNAPQNKRNEWDQFLEEDTSNNDTRQTETGTELLTALPEYKRPSKLGNNIAQNANKWSAQPKRNNVVTGVKRKWTASESRDSYESAPKYARHENTTRQVSNESPRLISTAHLAQSTSTATPTMTRVTSAPEQTQQHVIDRIRAVTANRAQSTAATATVRQVSNSAPHAQSVSSVTSTPRPMTAVTPSTASQKKKSEWDDFLDDEPADDTCQEQDGGELVFADDEGLATVTDEW